MPRLIFLLQVDMPPLKKRRGLAGSIVNTAVSAALIGTAVGLTVYRMWRDRGKDDQPHLLEGPSASIVESDSEDSSLTDSASHPPPPPYSLAVSQPPAVRVEHHGTPSKGKSRVYPYSTSNNNDLAPPPTSSTLTSATATPATTPRKRRREIQAAKRPVALVPRHRRQGSKGTAASSGSGLNSNAGSQPGTSTRSEFDFGYEGGLNEKQEEGEEEDQMDWIGGKLAELIAQGQRALNTEVVVMSEAREDEVDDGSGAWGSDEEEHKSNFNKSNKPLSRAGSVRSVKRGSRPMPIGVPSYTGATSSYQTATSPPSTSVSYASASAGFVPSSSVSSFSSSVASGSVRGFGFAAYEGSAPTTPSQPPYQTSYQTPYQAQAEREDPARWESPLVRESMERARARLMARRTGGV